MGDRTQRVSSPWIKQRERLLQKFSWQAGYGFFSISPSDLDAVRQYIAGQEEHHRKIPFQDEFRMLLREHGLEWDERYIWD
jgi:putative transposase